METLVGARTAEEEEAMRLFLMNFQLLPLSMDVADRAVRLRRTKLKMSDSIIQATAQDDGRLLLTRNTKDFPSGTAGVRIPYII